jgi:hypothetical protein
LKATKFPFGPCEKKWRHNLAGGCKDLPSEIRDLFEQFKSYKGGNDTLWAVNEIANTKKHCALIPLMIDKARANFNAVLPEDGWVGRNVVDAAGVISAWNPEKHEMTLVTVPNGMDPYIRGNFTFTVAISGIEIMRSQPAIGFVDQMRSVVYSVLMATEAECRRLTLI